MEIPRSKVISSNSYSILGGASSSLSSRQHCILPCLSLFVGFEFSLNGSCFDEVGSILWTTSCSYYLMIPISRLIISQVRWVLPDTTGYPPEQDESTSHQLQRLSKERGSPTKATSPILTFRLAFVLLFVVNFLDPTLLLDFGAYWVSVQCALVQDRKADS